MMSCAVRVRCDSYLMEVDYRTHVESARDVYYVMHMPDPRSRVAGADWIPCECSFSFHYQTMNPALPFDIVLSHV